MNIKAPKNIAQMVNEIKNLGYADVLLGKRFAFCFKHSEFNRLNEFIRVFDNVTDKQGDEPLFCTFFYVAYDNEENESCWAVDNEEKFMEFLSDAEFECIITPAPKVLKSFEKGWGVPFAEIISCMDN